MSFRLIDKIKKNTAMPAKLKRVMEAYLSYGNRDGTSIRPTERKVAGRAGVTRQIVSEHTQELVRLGFLVHDLYDNGRWATFSYKKHGVWAYIYHADLSPLDNPVVLEEFERNRMQLKQKRSDAARKSKQNQTNLFVAKPDKQGVANCDKHRVAKPDTDQTLYTPTLRSGDIDPRYADPNDNPSAVSTAVSEGVSESVKSVASLPPSGELPPFNRFMEQLHGSLGACSEESPEPERMSNEEFQKLINFLARKFDVRRFSRTLAGRMAAAHPYFVANTYNLNQLDKLLERPDWKKNIRTLDDFAFRWASDSEKGLYGQLCRVVIDEAGCEAVWNGMKCGKTTLQDDDGTWICEECKDKKSRSFKCKCGRDFIIPHNWNHPSGNVRCNPDKGGCGEIFAVPGSILEFVREEAEEPQSEDGPSEAKEQTQNQPNGDMGECDGWNTFCGDTATVADGAYRYCDGCNAKRLKYEEASA